MFGTLGGPELFLILVVALIVFGPRKLPEIGKSLGRMMNEFKKASNEFRQTLEDEVEADKRREATRIEAPVAVAPVTPGVVDETPTTPGSNGSAADAPMDAAPPVEPTVSREVAPTPIEPK
jgi:TatA/E family protein of Tat protein translocase